MITLNSTDFTTYLNGAVCFFHMFYWLFFIMIMNRLHCQGRILKCECMRRWSNHLIVFLLTVEAVTPLSHEDNRNCKRFAFICVHSIKKESLLFCKIFLVYAYLFVIIYST